MTLDVAGEEGNAIFHQLLARSDVLIENFRTDSATKLGLTPDRLLSQHPRLIVCSISGFGRTGPLRDAPGYDFAIQAMSGLMAVTGSADGPPAKVVINEYLDVAHGFFTGDEPRMANGVLNAVARQLRAAEFAPEHPPEPA